MVPLRYVVLFHEGFGEPHYDLMFESEPGGPLQTWRSPAWPPSIGDELIRLGDHRNIYLTYEGPVSNNRGEVKQIVTGSCNHAYAPGHPPQIYIEISGPKKLVIQIRNVIEANNRVTDRWQVVN